MASVSFNFANILKIKIFKVKPVSNNKEVENEATEQEDIEEQPKEAAVEEKEEEAGLEENDKEDLKKDLVN